MNGSCRLINESPDLKRSSPNRLVPLLFFIYSKEHVISTQTPTTIRLSRRQLLLGAGAVSLLTLVWQSYRHLGQYPKAGFKCTTLSDREVNILQVIGDWLIPPGGGIPGSGGDDITIQRIDSMLLGVPEHKRFLLSALPLAFEHGTLLFAFGGPRLTEMSDSARQEYLQNWAESDNLIQCQLMAAIKTLYGFGYFDRDDVLQACGLPYFCGSVT